jgi:hypothetical protein
MWTNLPDEDVARGARSSRIRRAGRRFAAVLDAIMSTFTLHLAVLQRSVARAIGRTFGDDLGGGSDVAVDVSAALIWYVLALAVAIFLLRNFRAILRMFLI